MSELAALTSALTGRYRIERALGTGGMATVYLAHDLRHHRDVAIKVLNPELAASIGAERFLKEIRLTAQLQHPHIVPLYDSGNADGALFYVMPVIDGESLRDRMRREPLFPVDIAVRIAQQAASALDYAHRHGVVHRDIKPENILLHDGEVLLADFGIAMGIREAGGDRLTGTGLSLGTPQYMSPEQAAGERDIDARSDVYSLGAVVYEMLAGEPCVTGPSAQAMIAKLMTERPTSLCVVRDVVSPGLDAAIMRALAKQPADRYASARDFADALTASMAPGGTAGNVTPAISLASGTVGAKRWGAIAAGAVVAIAAVVALVLLGTRAGTPAAATPAATSIRSIAVLPLDNYSADSAQDYFVEGMTDELTASLATIKQLRVTSRGSAMQFAGKTRPPPSAIAKVLSVDALVEGSVTRSKDRVRIIARLVDAHTGDELWSQIFDEKSTDVLALQGQLALAIANAIKLQLTSTEQSRLAAAPSVDPASHEEYLRGRYFFNRPSDENLQRAITHFEESVRISPTFAPAYSGLSDAYLWAGYNEGFLTASQAKPKARLAAERAVQLDSTSAEAYASLATFRLFYEFDWPGCERAFRRAIELNPNYAFAHDQFAMALGFQGRFDEAIAEGKRAIALDPLSPQVLVDATLPFVYQRDIVHATQMARQAGELDPTYFFPVMIEGWAYLDVGQYREAIPLLEKARGMDAPPFVTAYLAFAYGMNGDRAKALRELAALQTMSHGAPVLPFNLALVYLGLGDRKQALDDLERALAGDSQMMAWIGQDHMFDSLRSEPRFVAMLQRLHFAT